MLEYIWNKLFRKIAGRAIKNSKVHKTSKIEAGSLFLSSEMERYSFCGYGCKIINCKIGSFCSIADGVVIGLAEHPSNWVSTSPVFYHGKDSVKRKFSSFYRDKPKQTDIGNDVWIGENAQIKAGVSIGTGAIVGMGAIVTHDVSPYEIVAGVPAKHIRFRFDEATITELLGSEWWKLPEDKLEIVANLIRNPQDFLKEINRI